jgi:divalent metal cation (Fe/Co/Zn/Cd) transporter
VAASGLLLSKIFGTSVPDSVASLVIGLLLASTAIAVARPFADFLVGRSIALPVLEEILAIVESDAAVEQVLTFRAIYSGPEEVIVRAKIHPAARIDSEQFSRAMDMLDHKIRVAFPFVADVFIDVTATHLKDDLHLDK